MRRLLRRSLKRLDQLNSCGQPQHFRFGTCLVVWRHTSTSMFHDSPFTRGQSAHQLLCPLSASLSANLSKCVRNLGATTGSGAAWARAGCDGELARPIVWPIRRKETTCTIQRCQVAMRRHVMSKAAPLARFTSRSPPALARSRSLGSGGTPLQRRPAVTSKPRVTSSIERAQIMSLYSPRAAHKAKSTIRARNAALSRFRGSTNPPRLPPSPCQPFRQTNRSIRCRTARVDHRKV